MTYLSPLLQNNLNKHNGVYTKENVDHTQLYEHLASDTSKAAKPNEPKARLVKNTPVTCVMDMGKDCANFKKAVTNGDITDNNLGRINDLGVKIGSGLIASYLALHAKTKTDAIMKFVGGGAFLASMSLWPKLAIYTPMKLMHKIDPGQKYISAQGDKKEFYLDNQFILWDAAGVADEKEQRRRQKGALQARTLNLFTIGAASPLMASLFGNAVEPKIYGAVVNRNVKKAGKMLNNSESLGKYFKDANSEVKNSKELEALFNSYKTAKKPADADLFKQIADLLSIKDLQNAYKDSDDFTPLKGMHSDGVIEQLRAIYDKNAAVETDSIAEALKDITLVKNKKIEKRNSKALFGKKSDLKAAQQQMTITKEEIDAIIAGMGENRSISSLVESLKKAGLTERQIDDVLPKTKINIDKFANIITNYNEETLAEIRGRAKAYTDLLNPVVGSKYESAYTKEYQDTMNNLIKQLGVKYNVLKEVQANDAAYSQKLLSQMFASKVEGVEFGSQEYKDLIKKLTKGTIPEDVDKLVKKLASDDVIGRVKAESRDGLTDAIIGAKGRKGSFSEAVSKFIHYKEIDLQATKIKPAICANFEARLKAGEFKDLGDEGIEIAKQIIYDGSSAVRVNLAYAHDREMYKKVVEAVFNKDAFSAEKEVIPNIDVLVENLKNYSGTNAEKYFMTGSMSELFKNSATKIYNNKSWLRKFGGLAIILTAATLLIQPFFANIKKEYPENNEKKSGGVK